MWAIIGGSGFENFEEFEKLEDLKIDTPYGEHSSGLMKVKWNGVEAIFLSRHGRAHELLPTEINYKANVYALKEAGAKGVLSFSAVGSLKEELAPEEVAFVNQYIDFTKHRESTFCGEGRVGHISFAEAVEKPVVEKVKDLLKETSAKIHYAKTYICIEGPRFSSIAESKMFRQWGADVIGMTNMPEAYLAKELGLLYLPFSFVTDYDCWKEDEAHVTLEIVKGRMKKNYVTAKLILDELMKSSLYNDFKVTSINEGLMSGEPFRL